mmetsp:Transcript_1410/g.4204  ORF Transcript_1410/g.4204 Transcript_1410/m.4204 type:complete len:258 (-) Transcript_1410:1263-2036(-)
MILWHKHSQQGTPHRVHDRSLHVWPRVQAQQQVEVRAVALGFLGAASLLVQVRCHRRHLSVTLLRRGVRRRPRAAVVPAIHSSAFSQDDGGLPGGGRAAREGQGGHQLAVHQQVCIPADGGGEVRVVRHRQPEVPHALRRPRCVACGEVLGLRHGAGGQGADEGATAGGGGPHGGQGARQGRPRAGVQHHPRRRHHLLQLRKGLHAGGGVAAQQGAVREGSGGEGGHGAVGGDHGLRHRGHHGQLCLAHHLLPPPVC